jgi:hypothetical protein
MLRRTEIMVMVAGLGAAALGLVACTSPAAQPKSAARPSAIPSASGHPSARPVPSGLSGRSTASPPVRPPAPSTSSKPPLGAATGVVTGTVAADSQGPCYAVHTSTNLDFNLYSTNSGSFRKGQIVRATVKSMPRGVSCPGGGRQAQIVMLESLK